MSAVFQDRMSSPIDVKSSILYRHCLAKTFTLLENTNVKTKPIYKKNTGNNGY